MAIRVLLALLIGFSALLPVEAAAVTLVPGVETILNWDLTGATPPPPYTTVEIDVHFSITLAIPATDQSVQVALFDDLNGNGTALSMAELMFPGGITSATVQFLADSGCCPTIFDGVFSVVLIETSSEMIDVSATAMGSIGNLSTGEVPAVVGPSSVPEPRTVALLALGLVMVPFLRCRQASARPSLLPRR